MIPRPLYKILTAPFALILPVVAIWLWSMFAAPPKPYYVGWSSGFLYWRLLLPPLPPFPGSVQTPDQWHVLLYKCQQNKTCLATPAAYIAHVPVFEGQTQISRGALRVMLDRLVYGGSAPRTLAGVLTPAFVLWVALFITAIVLDWRRRLRLLHGIQIGGRRLVSARRFSGWFGRQRDLIRIDVEKPDLQDIKVP